jgi:enhancing lycopene biosynthesis protein 2
MEGGMAKVGVVLSGCGVYDGSEIHEAVCTLLALSQAGVEYQCLAPHTNQLHVIDHTSGKPTPGATRNVFVESARIARGDIVKLDDVKVDDYDAFIFPGGFGAAKNLCTFAIEGPDCSVQRDVENLILKAHAANKPMAFVCIAPVIVAKVLGKGKNVALTIGTDADTAGAIEQMGGKHHECPVKESYVDEELKIVSTPAYMSAQSVAEVYDGVTDAVKKLLKLVG